MCVCFLTHSYWYYFYSWAPEFSMILHSRKRMSKVISFSVSSWIEFFLFWVASYFIKVSELSLVRIKKKKGGAGAVTFLPEHRWKFKKICTQICWWKITNHGIQELRWSDMCCNKLASLSVYWIKNIHMLIFCQCNFSAKYIVFSSIKPYISFRQSQLC